MKFGLDNTLKRLSLKGRVWFILGTILTIFLSGGVGVFLMMNYITSGYQHTIDHYKKMEADFFNIRIQMLEMNRTEKDFFSSNDEIYVDLMAESFDTFEELFKAMTELNQKIVSQSSLSTIKEGIFNYKGAFQEIVKLTLQEVELKASALSVSKNVIKYMSKQTLAGTNLQAIARLGEIEASGALYLSSFDESHRKDMNQALKSLSDSDGKKLALEFTDLINKIRATHIKVLEKKDVLHLHLMKAEEAILKSIALLNKAAEEQSAVMDRAAQSINFGMGLGSLIVILITVGSFVLFNRLSQSMTDISNKIRRSSRDTFASSETLKSASDKVSKAASEQASAIQETVATLNQITAMVNKSVDNAQSSTEKANLSHQIASEGREAVNSMRQSMKDIEKSITNMSHQVDESNEQIEQIVKIINEISTKTAVINDIVFQTKLLSFNASVEAARAGEHGKGFAVVAEEVGNLAQMSGNAAKEISELLGNSSDKVQQIVRTSKEEMGRLVQEGGQKVTVGVEIANRCDEILGEVVDHVSNVKELMLEISHASKEQAEGVNNISIAMNELDEATHSNSDMAHETSSCSNELANQSVTLSKAVELLDTEVFGVRSLTTRNEQYYEPGTSNTEEDIQENIIASGNVHELHPISRVRKHGKLAVGYDDSEIPSSDNPGFEEDY